LSIIGKKTTGELTFRQFLSIFTFFLPKVGKFIKNYPVFSLFNGEKSAHLHFLLN
jgi:hypothetical protein